ncbi:signal transduction histidine kinase [Anaerosolibacter carboniphilus]|uniref:histidine kinase n=1 Tax=Anaerosolibacter carboniphilus TaxID=1417629 RepID=A0A841KUZ5_9FIRM|nr:HAMP domain-containing sensor histidine kinase [Anaerosolibacter carboniphilus]MBB6217514.1 signal transduction histidine kinase [Anaerosolibacter carboniphilus]
MDIKWKNKILLITWVLLLTFGLSGILSGLSQGGEYLGNYFKTQQFEDQLNQFINYLSMFELNGMTKEEMKKEITITDEEINEHRYRYGNLADQIENIRGQYEDKIQDTQQAQNKELMDLYIAERDEKIEDITNNFKSDEHIKLKIVAEKEKKIDDYYRDLEKYRGEFAKLQMEFKYYLKDIENGKVYTNLNVTKAAEADQWMSSKNVLFVRSYPSLKYGYISSKRNAGYVDNGDIVDIGKERSFEGKIAVSKAVVPTGFVHSSYNEYQKRQNLFYVYIGSALMALLLNLYLYKKLSILQAIEMGKWRSHYRRIPIDVAVAGFAIVGLITLTALKDYNPLYLYGSWYTFITEIIYHLIIVGSLVMLTLVQGNLLWGRVKGIHSIEEEWRKSLLSSVVQGIKEAFLIRSIGVQIILLLCVVFGFGGGAVIVLLRPRYILLYAPLFMIIGLPIFVLILKRAGYFNRIVTNTMEIVRGNMEPDLPVIGKSNLATLANNINTLKHGVNTSRKEQAKSERLKTELISNVSHDLRTPLTSIINYTELLKAPDLTEEDRESYVQIIDRKSKRLKVLIDDLFEASKMASGNIELVKERVDLVQLLQQALAEHNEAIGESTLQFRITGPDKPVYAVVDGQKLWRVFDNLIGNILKYALENTRVYVSVKDVRGKAIISFKNITKYELGQDIDELFERFKRGDTSRHTEGSGLGLAIAKSIIDLHGGIMDIEVDGDLFKITIELNTLE